MKNIRVLAAMAVCPLLAAFLCACGNSSDLPDPTGTETTVQQQTKVDVTWAEAESFSAPAELPPVQNQSDKKSEKPDTDTVLQRIEVAHSVYDLFIGTKPQMDKSDRILYENDLEYYRVTDPNLNTMDKLDAYVRKFFSEKITLSLLSVGLYVEIDGKLYVPDVGTNSTNGIILNKEAEITEKTKTREAYTLTLTIDQNADGKSDTVEKHNFVCEPVGKDGAWVFTHYEMY